MSDNIAPSLNNSYTMQPGPRGGSVTGSESSVLKAEGFFGFFFLNIIIVLLLQSSLSASQNPREKIFILFFCFYIFSNEAQKEKTKELSEQRKVCHCDFKGGDNRLYFSE